MTSDGERSRIYWLLISLYVAATLVAAWYIDCIGCGGVTIHG